MNFLKLPIVPFPPGMTPAGAPDFSLMALMQNINAYAEGFVSVTTAGTNTTLTAAQLLAKNVVLTAGASGGFTLTLPVTSKIIDLLGPTLPRDGSFWFPLYISNDTPYTATVTAGDASTTFSGAASVLTGVAAKFMVHAVAPTTSQGPFTLVFQRVQTAGASGVGVGTVTSVSVVTANGFAGTVATATSTPAITIALSGTTTGQVLFNSGGSAVSGHAGLTYDSGTSVLTMLGAPIVQKAEGVFLSFKNAGGTDLAQFRLIEGGVSLGLGFNALAALSGAGFYGNTGIGYAALAACTSSGTSNSGFGTLSATAITSGTDNTGCGAYTLQSLVTGGGNTGIGTGAIGACGTGVSQNTAVGRNALINVTSDGNTAVGWKALGVGAVGGVGNTALGVSSGINVAAGSGNVLLGYAVGATITSGNNNIGIGSVALSTGSGIITGSQNIAIGSTSGPVNLDLSDTLCVGYGASVTASNLAAIGSAAIPYKVGINMTTPSAWLHLPAGTATAGQAPLKLTSGTNLTTGEAGAFEYDGTNLFFTRSGTAREGVLTQSAVTTEVVVSDTTVSVNIGGTLYKLLARA